MIWFRCAATQGRTNSPVSPNAPPNCSTTATITGNVFWLETSKTAVLFSLELLLPPVRPERMRIETALNASRERCSNIPMPTAARKTLGWTDSSSDLDLLTWIHGTKLRQIALIFEKSLRLLSTKFAKPLNDSRITYNRRNQVCQSSILKTCAKWQVIELHAEMTVCERFI